MIGTRTAEEVLQFIDDFWDQYWTSPSYARIGQFTGLASRSTVHKHMHRLVAKGLLEKRENPDIRRSVLYRRAT